MKLSSFRKSSLRSLVAGLVMAAMVTMGVPNASAAFIDTTQAISIVANNGWYQELIFNYDTSELATTDVINFDADVLYELPTEQWIGIFHFDYSTGRYTEAVYIFNDII